MGWSSILEVPKKASLRCLYNIPKKVRDEVDFFDGDKHQSFLTFDFNILGIKVFYNVTGMIMKMWRTWWWEWSSILKVLKITSLQCFYNISKMKLWMEFSIFYISYQFWRKVARYVQSTEKGSLLSFSNILKKVLQLLLCSIVMQSIHMLYYNPGQNTWNKIEKSSKTGQDRKSLISAFACFLTATAKV